MFNKTLENLKNLATKKLNAEDIVNEVKARSESIGKLTSAEREKILDKLVGKILQGQDLGDHGDAIRTKIRARLFDKQAGDALFLSNLKYINEVLTGSLPRSLSDLSGFRDTLAAKLVQDAKGGTLPTQTNTSSAAGKRDGGGRNQGPRGDFDRGRRGDRRPNRNNERRDNNNQDSGRGGASHREANASNQQARSHDEAPKTAHSNPAPAHAAPSETTHAADRHTESAPE
jgi:hypothetical protein